MIKAIILSFGLLGAQEAPAPIPAVNKPTDHAKAVYLADQAAKKRGGRSEIAVLGTPHLSYLPKDFDMDRFETLVDKLAEWAPERIITESISGPKCDLMRQYTLYFGEGTIRRYCSDPAPARKALGLTGPEAAEEIERIIATPASDRPASERRHMAALFLAAGDKYSAIVQWLRLAESERKAGDGLTAELADFLDVQSKRQNENNVIAVALAVKLGHERLFGADHQPGSLVTGPVDNDAYAKEITEIWDNEWAKSNRAIIAEWQDRMLADPSLSVLDWYIDLWNSPEHARYNIAGDFGAAIGTSKPHNTGRKYFAYWEVRNLRMAASIREVIGDGRRVLAIVGASHKAHYERYLGVTSDLEIVDIRDVLK